MSRLIEIEGVGSLGATALIAVVGNANVFKNGQEMAAWLGLVPKQRSSGNKTILANKVTCICECC
ncbi:MAG: IS110 family transposase [Proteobacteria bacterium]|nr:IS110 family transposase [Pseudomonadota bacterium]